MTTKAVLSTIPTAKAGRSWPGHGCGRAMMVVMVVAMMMVMVVDGGRLTCCGLTGNRPLRKMNCPTGLVGPAAKKPSRHRREGFSISREEAPKAYCASSP
jgi:hypothetical protein